MAAGVTICLEHRKLRNSEIADRKCRVLADALWQVGERDDGIAPVDWLITPQTRLMTLAYHINLRTIVRVAERSGNLFQIRWRVGRNGLEEFILRQAIGFLINAFLVFAFAQTFATAANAQNASDCSNDVDGIGKSAFVQSVETLLNLNSVTIEFRECAGAPFLTRWMPQKYVITYHHLDNLAKYRAPIIHELTHVLQDERAHRPFQLLNGLCQSKFRVELGADFLVGVIYQKLWPDTDRSFEYQNDISVLGSFNKEDPDFHGTEADRASAFRLGFFVDDSGVHGDLWKDHAYFQKTFFSQFFSQYEATPCAISL